MKPYALLLLCACVAPDTVGVTTAYGKIAGGDGGRPWLGDIDGEAYWLGPYLEWNIGAATRHDETMEAMRRAEVEAARRTESPVPVVITHDDPAGTETSAPMDKILYGIGAVFIAMAAAIGVILKKRGKSDE